VKICKKIEMNKSIYIYYKKIMFIKTNDMIEQLECSNDKIYIYNLKLLISKKKNISIDEIHVLKSNNDCYDNNELIHGNSTVELKIIKNRCSICLKKSATIVGDCKYCECKYCPHHRLPEVHKCPKMDTCKKESFDKNYNTVITQKCVASMV